MPYGYVNARDMPAAAAEPGGFAFAHVQTFVTVGALDATVDRLCVAARVLNASMAAQGEHPYDLFRVEAASAKLSGDKPIVATAARRTLLDRHPPGYQPQWGLHMTLDNVRTIAVGIENSPPPPDAPGVVVSRGRHVHGGCAACGKRGGLRCACRAARYCSTACQRGDWRAHKEVCRAVRACDAAPVVFVLV